MYPDEKMPQNAVARLHHPSIRERLNDKKARLEAELAEVEKALTLLNDNPAFEAVQDAITRAMF